MLKLIFFSKLSDFYSFDIIHFSTSHLKGTIKFTKFWSIKKNIILLLQFAYIWTVSNVKVNTEIKNDCKETMLRIYFLTYEDTFYCRARETVDLSSALSQVCVFSVLKGPYKYYSWLHMGLFLIQLKQSWVYWWKAGDFFLSAYKFGIFWGEKPHAYEKNKVFLKSY